MKKKATWILAAALALAVVVGISFYAKDAKLKANDENVYAQEETEVSENASMIILEREESAEESSEQAAAAEEAVTDEKADEPAAAENETEEVMEETTEEVAAEEAQEDETVKETEKSVYIISDLDGEEAVDEGTPITLTAVIEGFGEEVTFQWQRSVDGENWEDVASANEMTYTFELTQENDSYLWRVIVSEE